MSACAACRGTGVRPSRHARATWRGPAVEACATCAGLGRVCDGFDRGGDLCARPPLVAATGAGEHFCAYHRRRLREFRREVRAGG